MLIPIGIPFSFHVHVVSSRQATGYMYIHHVHTDKVQLVTEPITSASHYWCVVKIQSKQLSHLALQKF